MTDPLRTTLREIAPMLEAFAAEPGIGPFLTSNDSPLIYSDGLPCYFLVTQGADRIVRRLQISSYLEEPATAPDAGEPRYMLEVRALALLTTRDGEPVSRAEATEFHQRNEVVANVPAENAEAELPPALHAAYDMAQSWGPDDLSEGIAVA